MAVTVDIKITLDSHSKKRSPTIEAEARWMLEHGSLWYPLHAEPKRVHPGCWVFFVRDGRMVARARADRFVQRRELARTSSYAGHRQVPASWNVECSSMQVATHPITHAGFQGFRYVKTEERQEFGAAFRGSHRLHRAPRMGLYEAAVRRIVRDVFVRDPRARQLCKSHHGSSCVICGFNFGQVYGPLAQDFIHVHHLKPLAKARCRRPVDPVQHLRPVCPNCHAVIHLRDPEFTIAEVKRLLRTATRRGA